MDPVTVGIGVAAIAAGVYTAIARVKSPNQFWKLEPMKQRYGGKAGFVVHVIGYTVIPILFGVVVTLKGLMGKSLFE